jgi:hypothetical protein
MILNISVYINQVETIELLAKSLGWKELNRSVGSAPLFMGGLKKTQMFIITYDIETDDKVYKSVMDLTILKSHHVIEYKM